MAWSKKGVYLLGGEAMTAFIAISVGFFVGMVVASFFKAGDRPDAWKQGFDDGYSQAHKEIGEAKR